MLWKCLFCLLFLNIHVSIEQNIENDNASTIVSSGLEPESTTEVSTIQIRMSSMLHTSEKITEVITTQAVTTVPRTTQKQCPVNRLFTQRNYRTFNWYSGHICPEIDINAGNSQIKCFRIYRNGYVKEGSYGYYYTPSRSYFRKYGTWMFAPYMADLSLGRTSSIKYSVYSKYTQQGYASIAVQDKLKEIDQHMSDYIGTFQSVWAIIITWENVRSRRLDGESWDSYPGVTFQMVLVTDGYKTYLLYLYKPCELDMGIDVFALMGFAGRSKENIYKDSLKRNSLKKIDLLGNTGYAGVWLFDITGLYQRTQKLRCLKWHASADFVPLPGVCPCTQWQAFFDFRFIWMSRNMFISLFTGRVCHYGNFWRWWWWWWWNPLRFGITQKYNRFSNPTEWFNEDFKPYETCCSVNLCNLYFRKRPMDFCRGYTVPFIGFMFGDPHIQTLDGFQYSFNGWGDYVFMKVYNKTSGVKQVEIQARTQLATNVNGTKVNATVFSAFAMKDFKTNATAEVEISNSTNDLIISLGDQDLTLDFQKKTDFSKIGSISVFRKSNATEDPSASFTFASGIDLTVTLTTGMLAVGLSIPENVKENIRTSGLQGNTDGNTDNDLTTPNGTVLSINSTEEEIYDNFGQLWKVKESESLFKFPSTETVDTSFRPLFLDKTSDSYAKALEICGSEDDVACIYDYVATENKAVAENTKSAAKTAEENLLATKYSAPEINGTTELLINVNESTSWNVLVTDNDNDTVKLEVRDGESYISSITEVSHQNGYRFTLDILIPKLAPLNISVSAIDSRNQSSGEFHLKVILCSGCSGHGTCNREDIVIEQQFYEELECTCDVGYDGENCSIDYDGCSEDPCDLCTDLSPVEQQALNRTFNCSCPNGYKLVEDNRCTDINECAINNNTCEHICTNTLGSFTCSCKTGYELINDVNCTNINECERNFDNCEQLCNDTTPGFNCSCRTGYELKADKFSCEAVIDNSTASCTTDCSKASGCSNNVCFCNKGFILNGSNVCVDENECEQNPCEGSCQNTNGSFKCDCPIGKKVVDKTKCEACDDDHWGYNCANQCDCSVNAKDCDSLSGCICQEGWTGQLCSEDINECEGENQCTQRQNCTNKAGSYDCVCLNGFERDGAECIDINECDISDTCPYACKNSIGSYTCECEIGFSGTNGRNCTDINECETNIHGCEQECINNLGSFACNCVQGYKLNDDRKSCSIIAESVACSNASCDSTTQYCSYSQGVAKCNCKNNYKYDNNTSTCKLIDVCENNPCKNGNCTGINNVVKCNCTTGYYQVLDTCQICPSIFWGYNCATRCDCVRGDCDNVKGCICYPGYEGKNCEGKINYCTNDTCDSTSTCRSLETNYICECKEGYQNKTTQNGNCTKLVVTTLATTLPTQTTVVKTTEQVTTPSERTTGSVDITEEVTTPSVKTTDSVDITEEVTTPGVRTTDSVNITEEETTLSQRTTDSVNITEEETTLSQRTTDSVNITEEETTLSQRTTVSINITEEETTLSQRTTDSVDITEEETTPSELTLPVSTTQQQTISPVITTTIEPDFIFAITLGLNMTFPTTASERKKLVSELKQRLIEQFQTITGFLRVVIIRIRNGSVYVDYQIYTNKNSQTQIEEQINQIKLKGLNIFNSSVPVLSAETSVCIKGCTPTDDLKLELGLGLGLSIPIVIIIIIIITIWFRRKSKKVPSHDGSDIFNTAQSYGSVSSLLQGKRFGINEDFLRASRLSTWIDLKPDNSDMPRYYDHPIMACDDFKIQRPHVK